MLLFRSMISIENEVLKVSANHRGAELNSIFYKPTATEHLWQADPAFWGWHAPVLFPVVGRCLHDEIAVDSKKYPMEKHGFARRSSFDLIHHDAKSMCFALKESEQTLLSYPFPFAFEIEYRLQQNELLTLYSVTNPAEAVLPFCLGGHPAFAVPFHAAEHFNDYYLLFEKNETDERHHIDGNGFFDGRRSAVFENGNRISLRESLFEDDALIFKNLNSRSVSIVSPLHSNRLTVNFPPFQQLGIWTKPGAPYVCIEPWLGCADTAHHPITLHHKEGVQLLPGGQTFKAAFTVSIQ